MKIRNTIIFIIIALLAFVIIITSYGGSISNSKWVDYPTEKKVSITTRWPIGFIWPIYTIEDVVNYKCENGDIFEDYEYKGSGYAYKYYCQDGHHMIDVFKNGTRIELGGGAIIAAAYLAFVAAVSIRIISSALKNDKDNVMKSVDAFYSKCLSLKVYDISSNESIEKLLLIGKSFGFETKEEALKYYQLGKKRADEAEIAKQEQRLQELRKKQEQEKESLRELREKEKSKYNEEKRWATITQKDKYCAIIRLKKSKLVDERTELSKFDAWTAFKNHKEDNWGWAGGIADALAGPGAGVMAAAESHAKTEQYNAAVDQYNSQLMHSGYDPVKLNKLRDEKIKRLTSRIKSLQRDQETIMSALIDEDNSIKYFENLRFEISKTYQHSTGYLTLTVKTNVIEPIKLLDSPATIDGSVKINVINSQGETVGEAYFIGGNTTEYKMSKNGFLNSRSRKVVAVPINSDSFDEKEEYTFEVCPVSIWAIEIVL